MTLTRRSILSLASGAAAAGIAGPALAQSDQRKTERSLGDPLWRLAGAICRT